MKKVLLISIVIALTCTACSIENTNASTNENQATKDSLMQAERNEAVEEEFKDFTDFEPLKKITITIYHNF